MNRHKFTDFIPGGMTPYLKGLIEPQIQNFDIKSVESVEVDNKHWYLIINFINGSRIPVQFRKKFRNRKNVIWEAKRNIEIYAEHYKALDITQYINLKHGTLLN